MAEVAHIVEMPGDLNADRCVHISLSEKNFMDLIQSSPDAVFVYVEEKIIFANKSGLRLLGATDSGQVIGHDVWEFVPAEGHRALAKAIDLIITNRRSFISSEEKLITVDGYVVDIEISSTYFSLDGRHGIQAFIRDISKRKRAEERLKKSENEYKQIVESTGTAILFIDEDKTISLINGECEKISGYKRDEIEGKRKWTEFVAPEDRSRLELNHDQRRKNQNTPMNFEFTLIDKFGHYHSAFMTISLIPGSKKSVASIIDLTEIQKAEEILSTTQQNYRILVENTKEAIAIIQDELVRYVNPKLCKITGYGMNQILNKKFYKLVHPDFSDIVRNEYRNRLEGAEANTMLPVKIIDTEKNERWFQVNSVLTIWGSKPAVLLFFNDITETKKAQDGLMASEEKYRLLAENADDIIVIYDQNGIIDYINRSGCETFGIDKTRAGYNNVTEILNLSPDFMPSRAVSAEKHDADSASFKNRVEVMKPDGSILMFETISNPIKIDNNKPGMLVIARDCTERKQLEKEIILISERIRQQVSRDLHDDLNPHLIGIEALAQVLAVGLKKLHLPEADEAEKIAELINKAITKTHRLARGLCPVDLESTGIQTPLMNLIKVIRNLYGMECRFDYDDSIMIEDMTLATNLYYIAQEATFNAAKYSGGSRIVITLRVIKDYLVLSVEDNGTGMRKPKKTSRSAEKRDGMGLKIMKYRAEIIDGILQITRNKPTGTTITVRMPINILKSEGRIFYGGRYTNQQQEI